MKPHFSQTKINVKLPFSFILFGLIAFIFSQWIFFQNASQLAEGYFRTPELWMAFHLLILGWAVMIAMGAMYQMVPVTFLTPIWSEKFGFIQFGVTATGILSLSFLLGFHPAEAVYGGAITIIGICMFILQMFMTIKKQKEKNMMTWLVFSALLFFLLTLLAGFVLAWNIANGQILNHQSIFHSHLVFGITGWFTLLIFGFSYKLVPMFSLSHGFSMKWSMKAFLLYILGLLALIFTFWIKMSILQPIGWAVLFLAFTLFLLDMREILAKRSKKRLDRPFLFAIIALHLGWFIHFLVVVVSIWATSNVALWSLLIYLYLMMWIIFSILGYLYKIVPVLWWTLKYADKVGKEKIPLIKDLINEKASFILYIGFFIGTLGVAFSTLYQSLLLIQLFQGLLVLTSFVYSVFIAKVMTK
ncbi:hypothetical protein HNQ94_001536 [Salirhabdus euzebyi]|uniref:Uncharacterized protein n=1 Tax=Salirhabdus euzebyi TaxID=394506 RepID=A0A841Q3W9_9BACI|nr:hypothetical protein [Salirhabdus euzebyi]MBB6453088.1 hypothetical protein [Salirhabdus euzebyi]